MPCPVAPASRWASWLWCLGAALVVYLPPACTAQLLAFDDNAFFGPDNPEFRDGLAAVFDPSRPIANAFLPIAHASLWFDWAIGGESPFWPHLHALLLHALAGMLLARLLLQLGCRPLVAHAAALLFVVHPALAESVAWVSGRKDVLSGAFVFAALHQTAVFARQPQSWRLLPLALLGALAMYSKATAVVLPLLAALVAAAMPGPRRRWLAPGVLLLVVLPIAAHHQAIAAAEGTLVAGSPGERLPQAPGAFLHYLGTALWPLRLNVLYPEVQTLERFAAMAPAGIAAFAAFAAAALALARCPSTRPIGCGLAAFVAALLPFNTVWPGSSIAAADRYLYLAVPGLALALAAATARLAPVRGPWIALALALPLAWLAAGRARAFADDGTLWRSSLATDPDNAVAHLNLVHDLLRRGPTALDRVQPHLEAAARAARYPIHEVRARQQLVQLFLAAADHERAAAEARAAIAAAEKLLAAERSEKRRAEARDWLLRCHLLAFEPLQRVGDAAGAAASHAAAAALAPQHPDVIAFGALRELAACSGELHALAAAGKPPVLAADDPRVLAAEATLAAALARHGQHAGLLHARAEWARASGAVLAALRWYGAATQADPQCMAAWLGAARLLREREAWTAAEDKARAGLRVRPDPALRQELALALVGQGRLDDAELHLEAYLRACPQDRDTAKVLANVLVGRAYAKLSTQPPPIAEVRRLIERALAYNPAEAKAHLVLGRLAADERRLSDAVDHFERAFRHLPDFADARQYYTDALARLGFDRLLRRDDEGMAAAFRRCLEVAPPGYDTAEMQRQLQRVWRQTEALGVARLEAGDRRAAAAAFRRCLALDPDQHWAAWLLATALHDDPEADPGELERLCRQAIAWQERHGLDKSRQVLLLATVLQRAGRGTEGRALAADYLRAPADDAPSLVLAALRRLADG